MDDAKLRAWWFHRQGLDGSLAGASAANVLKRAGWARSVAGSGPYLTFFSRAGISRESVDVAVANLEIHELPSARGCTYVLPADDFALGLRVGQQFSGADINVSRKLGVTDYEVATLCSAVIKALDKGPLSPQEIRKATGKAARNLGPEGAKKGLTTSLPLALGGLQASGQIRRVPINGRLDQQRYRYSAWKPNPLAQYRLSSSDSYTELARQYFRWIGPATLAEFQWFSGLGVKAAKAAIEPLGLLPADAGSDRVMFAEDQSAFAHFEVPANSAYAVVSCMDSMFLLRRELSALMTTDVAKRKVFGEKGSCELGSLSDLNHNAILDRGSIVGLWEYDSDQNAIAWCTFVPVDKSLPEIIARTEGYIRQQLGDARSFSLDSPKSRAPRVAAIRAAGKR
jgi:Winged helix DNA-binding domain